MSVYHIYALRGLSLHPAALTAENLKRHTPRAGRPKRERPRRHFCHACGTETEFTSRLCVTCRQE